MKTNKIIALAAAIVSLAACTKELGTDNGSFFEEGQKVTLCVTADMPATKVTSSFDAATGEVSFLWQEGDKIKVTVESKTAEFTLESGAGTANATFTGTMPASGTTFDVQYPVNDPDLSTQAYSSGEAIPHDMMKFAATGCTASLKNHKMEPQNAALRLSFYGCDREVSKIVVTNTTSLDDPQPTYTLNVMSPVKVGKTVNDSTSFFIVVPSGSYTFSVSVTADEVTPAVDNTEEYDGQGLGTVITNGNFSTSAEQTFKAGRVLNMPAKSLTTVWAPVNCGYSSTYTYGLLYQWGRQYGQAYETGTITPVALTKDAGEASENSDKFCEAYTGYDNWFEGYDNTLWSDGSKRGYYDPCPDGWRVPTQSEMNALIGGNVNPSLTTSSPYGCYFNGTSSASSGVFLPAAGYRNDLDGSVKERNTNGYYWSSSVSGTGGVAMIISDNSAGIDTKISRTYGYSVRCVRI